MKKSRILVNGLPMGAKVKISIVGFLIFFLFLNTVIPSYFSSLQYPGNGWVSVGLISLIVIFSIGSVTAESLVLGLLVLAFFSNWWDVGAVFDRSSLRNNILIGTIVLLIITSFLGKVSLTNLIITIKRQLGVKG